MRTGISSITSAASGLSRTFGICAVATLLLAQSTALSAAAEKYAAFVIDANTGKVLFSKNADESRYPASLTKMMTLYLLFEAIEQGRTSVNAKMKVSAYASARPPTKLGLKPGSTLEVEDAIFGLVTKSANDASVVIAEHLAGSEERFAQLMTSKARQLGMTRTTFKNANGLPNAAQRTTARDMATLGMALREHFPKEYKYFSTKSFNFRGRTIGGHNRLLGRIKGVDGIKTGYVNASGFNLVTSLATDGKKLVGVVMGGTSGAARDNQMAKLMNTYVKVASGRGRGPLVAERRSTEPRVTVAAIEQAEYDIPSKVPLPSMRASINDRIAAAYGSDAGDAIARMSAGSDRPRQIIGRDALRAALGSSRNDASSMQVPTVNSLAPAEPIPSGRSLGRPVPPGAIPGGEDADPTTTGSIRARMAEMPTSPWVVQIAAMPDKSRALEMLAEAKDRGGSALIRAEAFTETVDSGSQTLHRARFAGFQSKAEANKACAALKAKSYKCLALAN